MPYKDREKYLAYQRAYHHAKFVSKRKTLAERFESKIDKGGDCWIWTGQVRRDGYGHLSRGRRGEGFVAAHRLSWELTNGPIPEGRFVLHRCDNRQCVRPEHLFLGTQLDNMLDMLAKGRHWRQRARSAA